MHLRLQYQRTWVCILNNTLPRCKQLITPNSTLTLVLNPPLMSLPLTLKWLTIIRELRVNMQEPIISTMVKIFNQSAVRVIAREHSKAIHSLSLLNINQKECTCKMEAWNLTIIKFNMELTLLKVSFLRLSLRPLIKELITAWIRFTSLLSNNSSSIHLIWEGRVRHTLFPLTQQEAFQLWWCSCQMQPLQSNLLIKIIVSSKSKSY